jgi:hypothetical protein
MDEMVAVLLDTLERLALENYALRETLQPLSGWDDETVNLNKEKHRARVHAWIEQFRKLASNPQNVQRIPEKQD